jgi:hypothetical protein
MSAPDVCREIAAATLALPNREAWVQIAALLARRTTDQHIAPNRSVVWTLRKKLKAETKVGAL